MVGNTGRSTAFSVDNGGELCYKKRKRVMPAAGEQEKRTWEAMLPGKERHMSEKLIVLSMDAMVSEDIDYLKTKPNFSRLFAKCAQVEKMCTVYPSITYPAHVSMMTGCRPGKHGIYTNTHFNSGKSYPDWHLWSEEIQVEDVFAAAKRAGKTTASIYWPVTGGNPNVDYLINEFFFYNNEPIEETFASFGANAETLAVVRENLHLYPTKPRTREDRMYPRNYFDDFIMGCMCSMIRNCKPDVLLVHNCWLDSTRHRYGVFNDYVREGLDRTDEWLGQVIEAMEDAGIYEETNFALISDHGQRDFARRIKVNLLLRRAGLIDVAEDGTITDWRARSQSNGMSASIFLKDKNDKQVWQQVYDVLKNLAAEGVWGFTKVRTVEEAREEYGLYGDFSFIVETDGYTTFADGWTEPVVSSIDFSDYRLGAATHGYEPETGAQPVFVASGPAFRAGAYRERGRTIDEAPTFARILGASMPEAEGCVMEDMLAEGR